MDERKKLINAIEDRQKKIRMQEEKSYIEFGSYVMANFKNSLSEGGYGSVLAEYEELAAGKDDCKRRIVSIKELSNRLDAVRREIGRIDEQLRAAESKNLPIYEAVAAQALAAHRPGDRTIAGLDELIDEVSRIGQEIKDLESRSGAAGKGEENLLGKIVRLGSSAFAKSSKGMKTRRLSALLQKAGRLMLEENAVNPPAPEMADLLGPYLNNREMCRGLDARRAELHTERCSIEDELTRLGAGRIVLFRLRELEAELKALCGRLDDLYGRVGRQFKDTFLADATGDEKLTAYVSVLDKFRERFDENEVEMERLAASLRHDELNSDIFRMRTHMENLEAKVAVQQKEIDSLRERIAEAEKEIKRYETIRG